MINLQSLRPLNWEDPNSAAQAGTEILRQLAENKHYLRELLDKIPNDEDLFAKCEVHGPFDKIVLYDSDEQRFRIRLHIWREGDIERAHKHRFPIITHILSGSYLHIIYGYKGRLDTILSDEQLRSFSNASEPDLKSGIIPDRLFPMFRSQVRPGDSYFLDPDALHATFPSADCVSLCLRGPAVRANSIVMDVTNNKTYWQFGRADEHQQQAAEKQMSKDRFFEARNYVDQLGLLG